MQIRKQLSELKPGDWVLSVAGRAVNSRFVEVRQMQQGAPVVGPRGGKYTLSERQPGDTLVTAVVLVCEGLKPVVHPASVAVVEVEEDW